MRRIFLLAVLPALAAGVSTAKADPVTVSFAATVDVGVDLNGDPLTTLDGFTAGDSITGSFTYDTSATPLADLGTLAYYPLAGASVVDGGTTTTFDDTADSTIMVRNDGLNEVEVQALTSSFVILNLDLEDPNGMALGGGGDSLPASLSFSSFPTVNGNIADGGLEEALPLDFSAVPEPASILAFAAGLLGVSLVRRRRA